jgi:hypothetical protein
MWPSLVIPSDRKELCSSCTGHRVRLSADAHSEMAFTTRRALRVIHLLG